MKKQTTSLVLLLLLLFTAGTSFSQNVSLKMKRPPLNQLKSADLWSATIINSGEAFTAYMFGSMTNNENGELIATGQTIAFEVKRGTTNFKISDLPRIPDVNYLSKDPKYKESFMSTGGAPPGDYKICVELRYTNNTIAGDDCFEQKIMGSEAPQLISPRDEEEIRNDNPVFTWMHMKGPGSTQSYKIKIIEIKGDESPENAMLKNRAFFEKEGISTQLFQYPSSAPKFEEGKKYAWQITIGNLKSEVNIFDRWGNLKTPGTKKSITSFCNDFENAGISNWNMYSNDQGNIEVTPNSLSIVTPGSSLTSSNYALNISDRSGYTYIFNETDFTGDYTQKLGQCLCFDFKLISDVAGANVHPSILLVKNFDVTQPIVWGTNPQLAAKFTAAITVSANSTWSHICAPIDLCSNGNMPSSSEGSWQMLGGGTCNDWSALLSNTTALMFSVDMSGWSGSEIFEIDNVCVMNCSTPPPPAGGNVCDTFSVTAVSVPTAVSGDCCWSLNLTHPINTTGITGIQFLSQSPNTFVTGSSQLSSSTGWLFPVNNGQEFTIKKLGGNIPSGQQNAFVKFCLNKLSSPQHVVVNWLKADNSIVCSDTVTMNCDIPCVTFSNDTLICNGNNYDLQYSFTNNASYSINKIEVSSVTPSNVTVTPSPLTLSAPVSPGGTVNVPAFSVAGAVPGSTVCIKFKFASPDGCCWCYDSLCVEIPSCVCEEVGASVTGDPLNCCYSLNLQNNFSANYFTQVTLSTLEPGVTFGTWYTNTANNYYSTNNYPDNQIHLINDPSNFPNGYIPMGNSTNVLNFCLRGYTSTTQHVLVKWMRSDSVVCIDTLTVNCVPPPPETPCTQLINDSLTCQPDGTYLYTFHVKNNSSHTTTGFQFNPVTPGLVFTPANFSSVTIAPGMISPQQSMVISGVAPGSQFCFNISLYEHVLMNNNQYYDWCCYSDEICKTAPGCPVTNQCKFEVLIDSVRCKQNAAGQWYYNVSARIYNMSGAAATLNSVLVDNGSVSGTPVNLTTGMNIINTAYTFTGTITNPVCFTYRILKPGSADTCKYRICRELPTCGNPPTGCDCSLGKWDAVNNIIRYSSGGISTDNKIKCNTTYTVDPGSAISLFSVYNCNKPGCAARYTYRVNNGPMTAFQTSPYNPPAITGTTSITTYAWCGDVICDSCIITVTPKTVHNDCKCNEKGSFTLTDEKGKTREAMCGETITAPFKATYTFSPTNLCTPKDCLKGYTYEIFDDQTGAYVTGASVIGSASFNVTLNSQAGYKIVIDYLCGDKKCRCEIFIRTKDAPNDCNCGGWADGEKGFMIHGFNGNPSSEIETFVKCGATYKSIYKGVSLDFVSQDYLCKPKENCAASYSWKITSPSGVVSTFNSKVINGFVFNEIGQYKIILVPSCGGKRCDECGSIINVVKKGNDK